VSALRRLPPVITDRRRPFLTATRAERIAAEFTVVRKK